MKKIFMIFLVGTTMFSFQNINAQETDDPISVKVKTSSEITENLDVKTASKQAEKINESPAIISVITKEEIQGFGAVTLSDILNRAASMYMIQAGIFPANIGSVRGQHTSVFDNHVLLLINGRPLRDGIIGMDNVFYASFPIEIIERIELIRGPGSVLYGSNAFSGVINIITTKESYDKSYVRADVQYGSFGTFKQSLNGSLGLKNGIKIDFAINNLKQQGPEYTFKDSPQAGGSKEGTGNFSLDNQSAFVNIRYEGFTFTSYFGRLNPFTLVKPIKWKVGNFKAGQFNTRIHFYNDIGYKHKFNDKYAIEAKLTSNERQNIGSTQTVNNEILEVSKNTLIELTLYASPIDNLNLIAGGYYDHNLFLGEELKSGSIQKYAGYFQGDYTIAKKIKLIAGAQFLKPENQDFRFIPRLGAIFNATENIGAKILYSNAYRSPYPDETDIISPYYTGSHDLNPELIATSELQIFYHKENMQFAVTGYHSKMTEMINLGYYPNEKFINPIGDTVHIIFENTGSHSFMGIELEGKYSITENLNLIGSFIYQQNELNDSLKNAAFWPQTIGKVGVLYNTYGFSAGLWNSYFGQPTLVENPLVLNKEATGYNLLTANITFDIFELLNRQSKYKILFSVYADNLLDADISYPEFVLQEINAMPMHASRSIYGKLTFKF
jgi:outer membrane receptor for ferrienterochelin and colicin